MQAKLITRCGCSKWLEVPEPPPPQWRVELERDSPTWSEISLGVSATRSPIVYREFRFERIVQLKDGLAPDEDVAIYKEVLT